MNSTALLYKRCMPCLLMCYESLTKAPFIRSLYFSPPHNKSGSACRFSWQVMKGLWALLRFKATFAALYTSLQLIVHAADPTRPSPAVRPAAPISSEIRCSLSLNKYEVRSCFHYLVTYYSRAVNLRKRTDTTVWQRERKRSRNTETRVHIVFVWKKKNACHSSVLSII